MMFRLAHDRRWRQCPSRRPQTSVSCCESRYDLYLGQTVSRARADGFAGARWTRTQAYFFPLSTRNLKPPKRRGLILTRFRGQAQNCVVWLPSGSLHLKNQLQTDHPIHPLHPSVVLAAHDHRYPAVNILFH